MFLFRPLTREDLPFLLEVRNECRDNLHDNRIFTLAQCEAWFQEQKPDFHVIGYDGERVGYFRLRDHDAGDASIHVGADLHMRFRRRGLALKAYEAFLPLLKERYQVSTAKLEVLSHNAPARRLYGKLGFVEIDCRRGIALRDGVPVDSIVMAKRL